MRRLRAGLYRRPPWPHVGWLPLPAAHAQARDPGLHASCTAGQSNTPVMLSGLAPAARAASTAAASPASEQHAAVTRGRPWPAGSGVGTAVSGGGEGCSQGCQRQANPSPVSLPPHLWGSSEVLQSEGARRRRRKRAHTGWKGWPELQGGWEVPHKVCRCRAGAGSCQQPLGRGCKRPLRRRRWQHSQQRRRRHGRNPTPS